MLSYKSRLLPECVSICVCVCVDDFHKWLFKLCAHIMLITLTHLHTHTHTHIYTMWHFKPQRWYHKPETQIALDNRLLMQFPWGQKNYGIKFRMQSMFIIHATTLSLARSFSFHFYMASIIFSIRDNRAYSLFLLYVNTVVYIKAKSLKV